MKSKALIFNTDDGQELRINMISPWLKRQFAEPACKEGESGDPADGSVSDGRTLKVVKLSIDGGFSCPNRDGSKGYGGCLFCSESGSGDMASSAAGNSEAQTACSEHMDVAACRDALSCAMQKQITLLSDKWPAEKYKLRFIAYFQSHTNTYGPIDKIRTLFEAAIDVSGIVGLAVATRSDCITDEVLELFEEINRKTFLWVELGLQTIHRDTAVKMNLCHDRTDYDEAIRKLSERNIRVVTHLILGLPGETENMMMDSVRYVCRPLNDGKNIFGIKLHMLNVVKGSGMETAYPGYVPFGTMGEYIDLVIRALEIIPPDITIHRISGDAPRATLIAPNWSYQKRTILNNIHKEMRKRNTWQGRRAEC